MIRFILLHSQKMSQLYPFKGPLGILQVSMQFDSGFRLRRSLHLKVQMDAWVEDRQRLKPQAQGAMELNMILNQIEAKFQELNHRVRYTGEQIN